MLTPLEAMALQGLEAEKLGLKILPCPMSEKIGGGRWHWRFLFDLAGNAFSGQCVGAALIVAFASARWQL